MSVCVCTYIYKYFYSVTDNHPTERWSLFPLLLNLGGCMTAIRNRTCWRQHYVTFEFRSHKGLRLSQAAVIARLDRGGPPGQLTH